MSKPHRNYKLIFKNINLKKNVMFVTAYNWDEAYAIGSGVLRRLDYLFYSKCYQLNTRIYIFTPKGVTRRRKNRQEVTLELVNLHQNRSRKY